MNCDSCLTSKQGQDMQFATVKQQAKVYAIQNQISMAIYKEGYSWYYKSVHLAIAEGIPFVEVVSHHP